MARADLLLALVRSGAGGDELAFRRAAEALIAEEEAKKHGVLASQLVEALTKRRPNAASNVTSLVRNEVSGALLHERDPERRITDLVLPGQVRQICSEVIEEHHRRDLLRSHGVEPRHRLADRLPRVSYAELEEFASDVQRRAILSGPEPDIREVTQRLLDQWSKRAGVDKA